MRACPTCNSVLPAQAPEALCPRCLLRVALAADHAPDSGSFVAPSPKELAPHFPHLEIIALIGQGGMGAVYKARQIKLDRPVALKVLPVHADSDPAFAERFVREARALARLQHPHIVTVHDFGEAGGYYYLLMEHIDGTNLRQMMRGGRVAPERAAAIIADLGEALEYAHQHEVIHRDLKPENVLIDRQGRVKLADFGLAKLVGRDPEGLTLTGANQAMGTPHYMAPEQLERPHEVDHRADLYSLGVVAYELLTGELPLGRFDPPSRRSSAHAGLDDAVLRALERDPARRFQSAGEMLAAIRAAATATPPAIPQAATGAEPTMDAPTESMALLCLVISVVAVLAGILAAQSAWVALALLAVQHAASCLAWRPERRPVVGAVLTFGGLAAAVALLAVNPSRWWMLFILVFWYGHYVGKFFKRTGALGWGGDDLEEKFTDWHDLTPLERKVARAIYEADGEGIVTYPCDMEGEDLAKLREANELLPEERVLATVALSDKHETHALIFGSRHVTFPALHNGEAIRLSLSLEALASRQFVNHGKGVYAGDGVMLLPENDVDCAAVAALLNGVRRAVSEGA